MKKVLIVMMMLAQSAGVYAQVNLEDRQTANTPPPIADDQPALTGQRQSDNTHPIIRITRSETLPQTQNNSIYDVDFVIQSNENIPDIGNTASYKIARCLKENCAMRDTTTTYIPSNITATSLQFARISAEITLNNLADIRATWGFVLLRASASALRDAAQNNPVNTDGQPIEENEILGVGEGAIARRDRTPPEITLSFRQIRYRGESRSDLDGSLIRNTNVYELIFWVIPPADKTIPTLSHQSNYQLIHVSNTDNRTFHSNQVLETRAISPPGQPDSLLLIVDAIVSDDELESTKGFTIARTAADDLLDIWGNPPVRAEDGALIGTGTGGLISTRIISPSLADIKARIRAKVLLEGPLR